MDARELARVLKEGGEGADIIGEIGIGLNPELQLAGNILVDEGLYGAAHVGIGHNVHLGGQNTASQHMDIVFTKATFEVDGEIIMENGRICLT
jgi:2,5-dihydroxypyridine 5,6-dioxygenase